MTNNNTTPKQDGFARFASLLERLLFSPSRKRKLALLADYFRQAPPEDRGFALAILTGNLDIATVQPAQLRRLAAAKSSEALFRLSYAYVGDLGETIALLWEPGDVDPGNGFGNLSQLVSQLQSLTRLEVFPFIDRSLGLMTETERWVFVKIISGSGLRIGVSARLAKQGLAQAFEANLDTLETLTSAFDPPYTEIFQWLDGNSDVPELPGKLFFHPPMLAVPLDERELASWEPSEYAAEWKWDGVRVQIVSDGTETRLYSRNGEHISESFPEIRDNFRWRAAVDGELLGRIETGLLRSTASHRGLLEDVAPFNFLQQRLNRKNVSRRHIEQYPVMFCLYDILESEDDDFRSLRFRERRDRLESWFNAIGAESGGRFRLSPLVPFQSWEQLQQLWEGTRAAGLEGLMLKRWDSPYLIGRPKGHWFKWKRAPLSLDTVLMYAERGRGKRASFYSDYTFGVWADDGDQRQLLPVGKAYSGLDDRELARLDQWIRQNTSKRFGASVRAVPPEIVLEVLFDDVQPSTRHRSGVAMRFPRLLRIRWDKPASEADTLAAVQGLLPGPTDKG